MSETYNKYRGEVRFPLADTSDIGKAVLRFRLADLEKLVTRHGKKYQTVLIEAMQDNDAVVIRDFAVCGLKGEGGSSAPKVDWDDPPFPLGAVYQPILDALTFAITGLTPEEAAERERQEKAKLVAEVEKHFPLAPTDSLATSSGTSDGQPTSPA